MLTGLACLPAYGQLNADFTVDSTRGCAPLVVTFSDQSTGNPISWKWEFGNGNTSNLQNPQTVYDQPGVYTVTLTINDGLQTDQEVRQGYITIADSPRVDFLVSPTAGCYPLNVQFKDASDAGSGTVTSWLWDFGDGTLSHQPNPSHLYEDAGKFNVTLLATNDAGCTAGLTRKAAVVTNEGVKADFTQDRTTACAGPLTVQFTAQTNSSEPVTYLWDFGDGGTATTASPSHTYTENGVYTVILKASVADGCTDTVWRENLIHVGSFQSNFTVPQGCAGGSLVFKNTSDPLPDSARWTFSDGAVVHQINATHTFASTGTYTVQLINFYGSCSDTVTKDITTAPSPTAAFISVPQQYCSLPAVVPFTNQSTGAVSYRWDFGDSTTSTAAEPTHTYRQSGTFDVKLIATNQQGCVDSVVRSAYIAVTDPQARFSATNNAGCVPLDVTFANESQSEEAITAYQWDFGDGATSTAASPSHSYTKAGTYDVRLIIRTASGCADTLLREHFVRTGTEPLVDFKATPTESCLETPVQFTNLSKPAGLSWQWDFPDDNHSTETVENPLHQFHELGPQDVTLTVNNNGCRVSRTKTAYIKITPPKAAMKIARTCEDPYTVHFTDASEQATEWHWDFGDGTSFDGQNPPAHHYGQTGSYTVVLRVQNGQCTSTQQRVVHVIDDEPVLQASSTTICHGSAVHLTASGVMDPTLIKSYTWELGNGQEVISIGPDTTVTYKNNGTFNARVVTSNVNGCQDSSAAIAITVRGPEADFGVSAATTCPGTRLTFKDNSQVSGGAIRQWVWHFGDGSVDTTTVDSITHTYTKGGNYKVQLTVTDENGCSDTRTRINAVSVFAAAAAFSTPDTLLCPGAPIAWNNASQGTGLAYHWDFGDGTVSDAQHPSKTYLDEGTYSVRLTITTQSGCVDSMVRNDYIHVGAPHAEMDYADNQASCPPFVVSVTNKSENYRRILWDFGDGTLSHRTDTARHVYNIPGNYRLRMLVYGYSDGCLDSVVRTVRVAGPYGTPTVTDITGCSPHPVQFSATAVHAVSFRWDFGDGNVSPASAQGAADHTYEEAGLYQPKLLLTDERNCTVVIPAKKQVTVDGVEVKPTVSLPEVCDSTLMTFHATGTIFSADSLNQPADYLWNFGEAAATEPTSTQAAPTHRYAAPGTYPVTLSITTAYGCSFTETLPVTVPDALRLEVTTSADTALCRGAAAPLQASGAYRYLWSPAGSLDADQGANVWAHPDSTTTYQVIGYSEGDCVSDTAQVHVAVHPVPTADLPADTTIGAGTAVQLPARYSPDVISWEWSPARYLNCTGCALPVSTPHRPITYKVVAANQWGCTDSASVNVKLVCKNGTVFIPNTFTPNNDGVNDIFYPRGKGVSEVLYFRIYNRWGQLIFERTHFQLNDRASGWDGTFKGQPFTPGVFVYQTAMRCESGAMFELDGDITLIR